MNMNKLLKNLSKMNPVHGLLLVGVVVLLVLVFIEKASL